MLQDCEHFFSAKHSKKSENTASLAKSVRVFRDQRSLISFGPALEIRKQLAKAIELIDIFASADAVDLIRLIGEAGGGDQSER